MSIITIDPDRVVTPAYQIAKTTPWLRMTDEEAEKMETAMAAAPARLRQIYAAAPVLDSSSDLWATLRDMLGKELGKKRAAELLAPSPA